MSKLFDQYFSEPNISKAKDRFMYDIEQHNISNGELLELIEELDSKGFLTDKPFTRKQPSEWNEKYLRSLTFGYVGDFFSKEYLKYFAEVSEYVYKKKKRKQRLQISVIAIIGIATVVAYFAIIYRK